jgi:hypothetical protein
LKDSNGRVVQTANEYSPSKPHLFRDAKEIEVGMKDFMLSFKIPTMDNPHGLSVFDTRPKYISEKERQLAQSQDDMEKTMKAGKPHDFIKYHKLPMKKMPISQKFGDIHNKLTGSAQEATQFLD